MPSLLHISTLKRKPLFALGLLFIVLLTFMAIFAYAIVPDKSVHANSIVLQLANEKPGFDVEVIRVQRNLDQNQNKFKAFFTGSNLNYYEIPVNWVRQKDSVLEFSEYIGASEGEEIVRYIPLQDIIKVGTRKENFAQHKTFYLGTDRYGRDLLSRLVIGSRISLSVGFIAVLISLTIGIILGLLAGFYGGWYDKIISWCINVIWSLPSLLLVIAISFVLGKGFWQVFIAVGLSMWVEVARIVRGQAMSFRESEMVEAGKALGFPNLRILFAHILPNIAGTILVIATSNFAAAILLEAGMSFLGFGAQPPIPSWGNMIKDHYGFIISGASHMALLPGFAIMLLVYSFNMVSVGLRDLISND